MIHKCGDVDLTYYDEARKQFLKEYSKDLFTGGRLLPTLYGLNKKTRPYQQKMVGCIMKLNS